RHAATSAQDRRCPCGRRSTSATPRHAGRVASTSHRTLSARQACAEQPRPCWPHRACARRKRPTKRGYGSPLRKGITTAAIARALLAGGAVGATVFSTASSRAASTAATTTQTQAPQSEYPQGPPQGAPNGPFKPNEEPSHEAKESKQREAEETAGKFPRTSP